MMNDQTTPGTEYFLDADAIRSVFASVFGVDPHQVKVIIDMDQESPENTTHYTILNMRVKILP